MPRLSKVTKPPSALRRAREMTGLTQQELAVAAHVKAATISDLENGRNHEPSYKKATHIYQALQDHGLRNMSMDEVFAVTETAPTRVLPKRKAKMAKVRIWIPRT
jgi:transcriptional regulator with XRE-family HTH domain